VIWLCKSVYVSVIWPPQGGLPAGNMHGVMWGMNPISLAFSYHFLEYLFNRINAWRNFSMNYIDKTTVVYWWISWIPTNTNFVKFTEQKLIVCGVVTKVARNIAFYWDVMGRYAVRLTDVSWDNISIFAGYEGVYVTRRQIFTRLKVFVSKMTLLFTN